MKSFQYWTWIAVTLLALTVIAYVATPSLRSNSPMVATFECSLMHGADTTSARLVELG